MVLIVDYQQNLRRFPAEWALVGMKMPRIQLPIALALLGGCLGGSNSGENSITGVTPDAAPADETIIDASVDNGGEEPNCPSLAPVPLTASVLEDFSGANRFVFDGAGNVVSNHSGVLVRESKSGNETVLATSVEETAGMAFLANGDLVVASITNGELWAFTPTGDRRTIVSELDSLGGVAIDEDDFIYFADPADGKIQRVHAVDGGLETIAQGLLRPYGLTFSPDYETLFVGSFGEGTVHSISSDGEGNWASPTRLGGVLNPCEGKEAGALCMDHISSGVCEANGASPATCVAEGNGQAVFQAACAGRYVGESCVADIGNASFPGTCEVEFGQFACAPLADLEEVCDGKSDGDACQAAYPYGFAAAAFDGTCQEGSCALPEDFLSDPDNRGGLDALAVDECGNVYSTEYITGHLWRFSPDGERKLVAALPTAYPSSLHWGTGVGGWDADTLYVMDSFHNRILELYLGVSGKPIVFP